MHDITNLMFISEAEPVMWQWIVYHIGHEQKHLSNPRYCSDMTSVH